MENVPFDGRRVSTVFFDNFHPFKTEQRGPSVESEVVIGVANADGNREGPYIRVRVNIGVDDQSSLQEIELAVLGRALSLIKRIAAESPQSLFETWVKYVSENSAEPERPKAASP
jgi:hypothetical protein